MLTTKNLLAGLGAFAGLGIALMPLASASAIDPVTDATGDTEVKARIGETIAIEVVGTYDDTTNEMITLGAGEAAENFLIHEIQVTGNTKADYGLTVEAGTGGNAMKHSVQTSVVIPAVTTGLTVEAGESAWGYAYGGSVATADKATFTPSYASAWSGVPASGSASLKSASSTDRTASYDETHYVKYGVSASDDQLSGVYTAQVIYRATAAGQF